MESLVDMVMSRRGECLNEISVIVVKLHFSETKVMLRSSESSHLNLCGECGEKGDLNFE